MKVVQDLAIRQALSYVIDRQNLVDDVFSGQAAPGNGMISPYYKRFFQSYADDPEIGYQHDPEKARQILADGGWVCPDGGICEKDGVKAQFELMTRVEQLDDQNASKRIKAWAREIGIDIKLSPVSDDAISNGTYATGTEEDKYGPDYDAFLWGWSGDVPSPDFNFDVLRTNSAWQDTYYSNPEYDRISLQSLHTLDEAERIDLMHQAERIALRDLPYIYLVHDHTIYVTRTRHLAQLAAVAGRRGGRPADHQLAAARRPPGGPGARAGARGGAWRRCRRTPPRRPWSRGHDRGRTGGGARATAAPRRWRRRIGTTAATAASRPAWWCSIALLALSVGAIVVLLATPRPARGPRAPRVGRLTRDVATRVALRVGVALVHAAFVLVFNFFMIRAAGDPVKDLARNPRLDAEAQEALIRERGLDQSTLRAVPALRRGHADARPRHVVQHPAAGLGRALATRCRTRCWWSASAPCWRRCSAP